MAKLKLPTVTLAAYTSIRIEQTIKALEYSCKDIDFGDVVIISDVEQKDLPTGIRYSNSPRSSNIDEWNYNIIYDLPNHINTDFVILIHDNGFIVNPKAWREDFLKYDYIGAPWPLPTDSFSYRDIDNKIIRVGNSVSLRSKKLLEIPIKENLEWMPFHGYTNEDGFICVNYRHKYIENDCIFADIDIAKYFSHETEIPEIEGTEPFAFHNYNGKNSKYPKF